MELNCYNFCLSRPRSLKGRVIAILQADSFASVCLILELHWLSSSRRINHLLVGQSNATNGLFLFVGCTDYNCVIGGLHWFIGRTSIGCLNINLFIQFNWGFLGALSFYCFVRNWSWRAKPNNPDDLKNYLHAYSTCFNRLYGSALFANDRKVLASYKKNSRRNITSRAYLQCLCRLFLSEFNFSIIFKDFIICISLSLLLFIVISALVWKTCQSIQLNRDSQIAAFFTASHKSVCSGVPLILLTISSFSEGSEQAMVLLPLIAYYFFQVSFGAYMTHRFRQTS